MPVLRKIFWKIILIVGGVLLCILFVAITVVWSLTDYIFRKLESNVNNLTKATTIYSV